MDATGTPLEEITWRSPQHVQAMGGFLHSNNILFYFSESPFFDATSNNASLAIQAMHNENLRHFIETREAFEGRLKTMQGVEFIVAHDPIEELAADMAKGAAPREPSNVWVIRKQLRTKRGGLPDQVQVLATYFIVGDFIYMAPSVLSVVGRRMLTAVTSLTRVLSTASPLLMFSPTHGHTYMPPASKSIESSQLNQEPAQPSKEATPMPGATTVTGPSDSATSEMSTSDFENARTLAEAMNLLARFGDEYMDENPLVGEPGAFIFSKNPASGPANAERGPPTAASAARQPGKSTMGTPTPSVAPPPSVLKIDQATLTAGKKAGKGGDSTPVSPGTPVTLGSGKEKAKKRKTKPGQGSP